MILFPNCKINLGLRILRKRPDGYHDLETIFYPVPLKDALELTRPDNRQAKEFDLRIWGTVIPGELSDNLCTKAFELIKADHPETGPLRLDLLKHIPTGAGLGGGSSDGAFTLLLLNQLLRLDLSTEKLIAYALQLGSDCPFFMLNKPCLAEGRGERLTEISVDLRGHYFVLVDPGIPISTTWAFSKITPGPGSSKPLTEIIAQPVGTWKDELINDFERSVFEEHKTLKLIKDELYAAGATYASLTGTGSCLYGIFKNEGKPRLAGISSRYRVYPLNHNG